jgi:NADH:ubiquinone oxidoreductase subunit F (NADH-binding)/(2Fe-2S) ferredoxin
MNAFTQHLTHCTHSAETPCRDFITCVQQGARCEQSAGDQQALAALKRELLFEEHEHPIIFVGMGTCGMANGAQKVYDAFVAELEAKGIIAKVVATGCGGYCAREVLVDVKLPGHPRITYAEVTPRDVPVIVRKTLQEGCILEEKLLGVHAGHAMNGWGSLPRIDRLPFFRLQRKVVLANCGVIDPADIDQYIVRGGYGALSKALDTMTPDGVIADVLASGLRGRGGGGFPTGKKWQFARGSEGDTKYLICNADEGDPGAFMDRAVLEGDPHRIVEGMTIAAYAIGASSGYIYCRAEYPLAIARLEKTIADARAYGLLGVNILGSGFSFDIRIKKGAGAFVCGEETALIHSIEGARGMPTPRPPYPAVSGLFGKPTVINNVETFANIPVVVRDGGEVYAQLGTATSKGTKVFALSGKIANTGLVEVPMGITLREIVFDIGGGVPGGLAFKAVQIGGPSGGTLPESVLDTPVDYEHLKEVGAMMGSGGLVVMDETTCMVDVAKYFMTFIQSESCGKCIPCREGTKRLLETLERLTSSYRGESSAADAYNRFQGMVYLERLAEVIQDTSLCGLGQSAANPVLSTLRYFRDEYEAHLYDRRCPAGLCRELLTYHIDNTKCTGCTLCAIKCPTQAILGEKKHAHYIVYDKCTRCDQCRVNCNYGAVYVN